MSAGGIGRQPQLDDWGGGSLSSFTPTFSKGNSADGDMAGLSYSITFEGDRVLEQCDVAWAIGGAADEPGSFTPAATWQAVPNNTTKTQTNDAEGNVTSTTYSFPNSGDNVDIGVDAVKVGNYLWLQFTVNGGTAQGEKKSTTPEF